ncbi:MAG: cyclic pyranopterin monophosphate synthase MoaC [Pseudomonadales bacterium]|nr:cyclic pyranopterin monophosphate synthase MoaC [Pseudomonadales bacterium]
MTSQLTHLDKDGNANMVDVGDKAASERIATASGYVKMAASTLQLIADGGHKKGDVLSVARIAGIQAAKQCSQLIPLCHPLMLNSVKVDLELDSNSNRVNITATCRVHGKTGVEMEALTAVSVSALTIYDMCKAVDKDMVLGGICLQEKSGGRSGHYQRAEAEQGVAND